MAVKIKVCGLTNLADAQAALNAGADLLGFIFYPKSPRHVSTSQAADIIASLQKNGKIVKTVGVFVNQSPQDIAAIMQTCGLDLAQLHGEEKPTMLNDPRLCGRAYKAIRPRDALQAGLQAGVYAQPASDAAEYLPGFPDRQLPSRPARRQRADRRLDAGCQPDRLLSPAAGRRPDTPQRAPGHRAGQPLGRGCGQRY